MKSLKLLCAGVTFLAAFGNCAAVTVNSESTCRTEASDAVVNIVSSTSQEFTITGRADICSGGFEIISSKSGGFKYLLAAPIELGLSAKRQVYILNHETGASSSIGELPASAEQVADLIFSNKYQEGASIFQDRYAISKSNVNREPSSIELAFEGQVCLDIKNHVYRPDLSSRPACKRSIKASRSRPICLLHRTNTSAVVPLAKCSALKTLMGG